MTRPFRGGQCLVGGEQQRIGGSAFLQVIAETIIGRRAFPTLALFVVTRHPDAGRDVMRGKRILVTNSQRVDGLEYALGDIFRAAPGRLRQQYSELFAAAPSDHVRRPPDNPLDCRGDTSYAVLTLGETVALP